MKEAKAVIRNYIAGSEFPTSVRRGMSRYNALASYVSIVLVPCFRSPLDQQSSVIFLESGHRCVQFYGKDSQFRGRIDNPFHSLTSVCAANKENRPLLRAVFTNGKISLIWARDHMQKFLDDGE
jgi:hypothetical protein